MAGCRRLLAVGSHPNLHSRRLFATGGTRTKLDLSGVFPPIPTPFTASGGINVQAATANFDHWNKIPFSGYVVMGSNGEAVSLDWKEKLELLRTVRKLAKPSAKIIAGLGMNTAEQTIDLCNAAAEEESADGGLIITPSFYKGQMTSLSLIKYYEQVAEGSRLPIILYSVPGNTGIDLSPEVPSVLAAHHNCIGMKDSGGDITKIGQIVNETRDKGFQVLAGSAGFFLPSLLMGAVGGICALANVLGTQVCQLYSLFQENKISEAVELQRKLIVPNLLVTKMFGVPGLKAAMDESGLLVGGPCRSPLLPIQQKELETLKLGFAKNQFPLRKS